MDERHPTVALGPILKSEAHRDFSMAWCVEDCRAASQPATVTALTLLVSQCCM